MSRIAITGHRGLPPATVRLVDTAIRTALAGQADLTGLSCLADGADQIFARAVADAGGRLEVIIPAAQYRQGLPQDAWATYDALLALASTIRRLPFIESVPEAHMAASLLMIDHSEELYAVWDGLPARAYGGTADAVEYARQRGLPVTIIWPDGATRGEALPHGRPRQAVRCRRRPRGACRSGWSGRRRDQRACPRRRSARRRVLRRGRGR
jgi:hypothetical protein